MAKYGLRIAQPEKDASTDKVEDMVYDSEYDTLKLYRSDFGSISVPAADISTFTPGHATVSIPHGLPYTPVFMVFTTSGWRGSTKFSPYSWRSIGIIGADGQNYSIDSTNLYIDFYNGDPSGARTVNYRYHIYYNELEI